VAVSSCRGNVESNRKVDAISVDEFRQDEDGELVL
jgi:hypothetical protein